LGYERLRVGQDRLKEKRSALRARLDALRSGLPDLAELDEAQRLAEERLASAEKTESSAAGSREAAEKRLADIRPQWQRLQQLRETALALATELRVADH